MIRSRDAFDRLLDALDEIASEEFRAYVDTFITSITELDDSRDDDQRAFWEVSEIRAEDA